MMMSRRAKARARKAKEKERARMMMMSPRARARARARTSPREKARARARTSPRAKERARERMTVMEREKARREPPRDTPAGSGVEAEPGTAGMTGVIPAATVAMEERAKGKVRERAKGTPIGDNTRQPKEGRVCSEVLR